MLQLSCVFCLTILMFKVVDVAGFILGYMLYICDALRDLIPFVQLKKREKTPMEECYF